jgi:hypothetical protein
MSHIYHIQRLQYLEALIKQQRRELRRLEEEAELLVYFYHNAPHRLHIPAYVEPIPPPQPRRRQRQRIRFASEDLIQEVPVTGPNTIQIPLHFQQPPREPRERRDATRTAIRTPTQATTARRDEDPRR